MSKHLYRLSWLAILGAFATAFDVQADDELFRKQVAPILARRCLSCHDAQQRKGDLSLETRDDLLELDYVVAHDPDASYLFDLLIPSGGSSEMPKDSDPLKPEEIEVIRSWIAAGGVWPVGVEVKPLLVTDTNWWSLRPLVRPVVPQVVPRVRHREGNSEADDVGTNPIDLFVADKHQQLGLTFAPEASRSTLVRRLYFDLIGLPPTPEEIERYVADSDPDAYSRLVDRLLASPHYGERWARHWLDVVHYADTHGYDKDKLRPHAWPYRDYVIRSLNEDKPWSRFVQEQVAGDVLYPDTRDGNEALGFIAAGPWDFVGHAEVPESKIDGKIARHLDRDDMVRNTIQSFNSLTAGCAQCHNHKFDPISQEDYYSLQAVFAAVDRADKSYFAGAEQRLQYEDATARKQLLDDRRQAIEAVIRENAGTELVTIDAELKELEKAAASVDVNPTPRFGYHSAIAMSKLQELRERREGLWQASTSEAQRSELQEIARQLEAVTAELRDTQPSQVYAGTVHQGSGSFVGTGAEGGKPRPVFLLTRGDVRQPAREVGPGTLRLFENLPSRFELPPGHNEGARRAALAHWLAAQQNHLTWRSIVNRVWQYHFGCGLVETPNDFGRMGALPSHAELLDYLASEFRDNGQSLKSLHKLIVTSYTYRQSSCVDDVLEPTVAKGLSIDADNHYLWKMTRRKLEAEAVRDSILLVSGKLDMKMGGPAFQDFVLEKPEHSPHYEYHLHDPEDPACHRRSIYRFIVRSQLQPFMTALDCADPSLQVGRRGESITPLQALALLNDGLVVTMSKQFAAKLERGGGSPRDVVYQGFFAAVGRAPTIDELDRLARHAERFGMANYCRVLFNLNEFSFVD